MSNDQELPPLPPQPLFTEGQAVFNGAQMREYARTALAAQAEQLKAKDEEIEGLEAKIRGDQRVLEAINELFEKIRRERDELRAQLASIKGSASQFEQAAIDLMTLGVSATRIALADKQHGIKDQS